MQSLNSCRLSLKGAKQMPVIENTEGKPVLVLSTAQFNPSLPGSRGCYNPLPDTEMEIVFPKIPCFHCCIQFLFVFYFFLFLMPPFLRSLVSDQCLNLSECYLQNISILRIHGCVVERCALNLQNFEKREYNPLSIRSYSKQVIAQYCTLTTKAVYLLVFGRVFGMRKVLGQGSNPRHSRDNARSLTARPPGNSPKAVPKVVKHGDGWAWGLGCEGWTQGAPGWKTQRSCQ